MAQMVFERVEMKYLLTQQQKQKVLEAMQPMMQLDQYGRTEIRNIYFDTDNYRLIRHSIEKPAFKEKMRIRSYGAATDHSKVFVELKRKAESIVYKRRIMLNENEAEAWLSGQRHCQEDSQIVREIDYFMNYYQTLHPVCYLSYQREAYYDTGGTDFRVTFDDTILMRQDNLSLKAPSGGIPLLEKGMVLMEIKCSSGMPLWMARVLSEEKIYKTSFSKYGTAYQNILSKQQEDKK